MIRGAKTVACENRGLRETVAWQPREAGVLREAACFRNACGRPDLAASGPAMVSNDYSPPAGVPRVFAMTIAVRFALACGLFASALSLVPASAQKMPSPSHSAFVLFEFDVKDPVAFKDFAPKVRATLKDYKGEFVMREKVDSLFGGKASNLSVISFPSVEDARKWLGSAELGALKEQRDKIAAVNTYLVEKVE